MARPPTPDKHQARRERDYAPIAHALETGRYAEARDLAEEALRRHPGDGQLHLYAAAAADKLADTERSEHHARRVMSIRPHPEAMLFLSRVARSRGETDQALELCDGALAAHPGHVPYLIHRAGTLEEAGRVAEARAVVDPLIAGLEAGGAEIPPALKFELAKLLVQERSLDRAVGVIDEITGTPGTPERFLRLALYLRAKAQDRMGDHAGAFETATRANAIGRVGFDPALYERQVGELIAAWSGERLAEYPVTSCEDELPVFVAGMPRSGTSLIDQIVDAHPLAAGVGELSSIERFAAQLQAAYDPDRAPAKRFGSINRFRWNRVAEDYVRELRRLAPGAERVVNKALGNARLVGLLSRLFPRTRVIHSRRDPRDVAVSCYMGGFNNAMFPWTTRLEWVSCAWEQSERMMEHWKRTLDIPILDVRYEDLVRDPETQMPRIIGFLGLAWDDACREFFKSRRTVRTLSYDQVNRPLYASSAGRHRHFEAQLASVRFPAYEPGG